MILALQRQSPWRLTGPTAISPGSSNEAPSEDEGAARSVNHREQKAGNEGEMIHEEPEFRLIAAPVRRAVEREGQEQDIGGGKQRRLGEEGAGPERDCERGLEEGGDPRKRQRERKSRRGDVAGGRS